jgi:hypothetical protein
MSAWICSDKHIASVVCAVLKEEYRQKAADMIKKANIRSVNYRYNEHTKITPCDLTQAEPLLPGDIVKLAHSIDYQSCERPDWYGSKAREQLKEIVFAVSLSLVPDDARWSI